MLILKEPFATSWKDKDPFQEVEQISGDISREVKTRRTLRFDFENNSYYLKLHHGISYGEAIKNILQCRLPVLGADREWRAINELAKVDVDTMKGVAYGEKGTNPIKKTSFIITEDLSPSVSLEDYCKNWAHNPPTYSIKRMLIKRVATMVRKMHLAGINHRDCYICHFLLALPFDGQESNLKLSIIDLHRAQFRDKVPTRWRNKDLISLYYSVTNIGLTLRDYCLFLKTYFDKPLKEIFKTEAELICEAELTAFKIRARSVKKGYEKLALGSLIGRGTERECFENSNNPRTCFKVSKHSSSKQTRREIKYFYYLLRKGIQPDFLPKFYGHFSTTEYIGFEQERLKESEQYRAIFIREYIKEASLQELQALETQLETIKQEMIKLNVIISDMRTGNTLLLINRATKTISRIVFFDGFGAPELIPLAAYCPFFGRMKIERQWDKFMTKYKKEKHIALQQSA